MKKKFYIKTAIFALMGGLVLFSSSCLKDSHYVDYGADAPLVEFPLAEYNPDQVGGSDGAYQPIEYSIATQSTDTLTVAIKIAAPKTLTTSVPVTISTTDVTALNAYNTANGTTYTALPSSDYSVIGGDVVTVPANQQMVFFKIIINSAAIGVGNSGAFVLPLTIENAGSVQIATPEKALLYNIAITK